MGRDKEVLKHHVLLLLELAEIILAMQFPDVLKEIQLKILHWLFLYFSIKGTGPTAS